MKVLAQLIAIINGSCASDVELAYVFSHEDKEITRRDVATSPNV